MVTISPVYRDIFQSNDISDQRDSAKAFIILSEKLVMALFAFFVLTFIPLLWVTHRIFGPLINFSNIFRRVSSGDLTARIFLRRGDLLKSEAGLANEMIQSISDRINEIKRENNLLVAAFNESACGNDKYGSFNKPEFAKIHKQALACQELLANFKIDEPSSQSELSSNAGRENSEESIEVEETTATII